MTNYFFYLNSASEEFQTDSKYAMMLNGGNSTVDSLMTADGFRRTFFDKPSKVRPQPTMTRLHPATTLLADKVRRRCRMAPLP